MRFLLLALAFLVSWSCGYRTAKVVKEAPKRELVYYAPVKGVIKEQERGFFIQTRCGEFFRSVEAGKVVYSGRDVDNYGWVIIIEQKDGNVGVYGRVGKPWVNQGERVKVRQVIGKVGKFKGICGLYFEVRDKTGKPLRPLLR
jgi:septal ring factor EnvC (AmiA/AmiB activator)